MFIYKKDIESHRNTQNNILQHKAHLTHENILSKIQLFQISTFFKNQRSIRISVFRSFIRLPLLGLKFYYMYIYIYIYGCLYIFQSILMWLFSYICTYHLHSYLSIYRNELPASARSDETLELGDEHPQVHSCLRVLCVLVKNGQAQTRLK